MATFTFSDAIPGDAIKALFSAVTSPKTANKRDCARAGFVLADYGLQFVIGEPSLLAKHGTAFAAAPATFEDCWAQLKPMLDSLAAKAAAGPSDAASLKGWSFDWATFAALVLKIIPLIIPFLTPATP